MENSDSLCDAGWYDMRNLHLNLTFIKKTEQRLKCIIFSWNQPFVEENCTSKLYGAFMYPQ